jgi:hypothetical protein
MAEQMLLLLLVNVLPVESGVVKLCLCHPMLHVAICLMYPMQGCVVQSALDMLGICVLELLFHFSGC